MFVFKIFTIGFFVGVLALFALKVSDLIESAANEKSITAEQRSCGIDEKLREQLRVAEENKFIVVVIGDGVKDSSMSHERPYSSHYSQGWDLYEGVNHASKERPDDKKTPFNTVEKYLRVLNIDDGGDSRCAELLSQEITNAPRVIAVLGHATTATTKIALKNYQEANMPVILPAATSPTLISDCKSCFRLPSNDNIQAKAIADFVINGIKANRVYLVWDASDTAVDYSGNLRKAIVNLIGSKIRFQQSIKFQPMDYGHLLKSITLNKSDAIIYCGYGSLAREFFNGLRFEYQGKEDQLSKPKVILSDGSRIPDIQDLSSFGFETYLSFPSEPLDTKVEFDEFVPEKSPSHEGTEAEESYEVFGYDALILTAMAFQQALEGGISRDALKSKLSESANSPQLSYDYQFANGENAISRYYIYSLPNNSVVQAYKSDYLSTVFEQATPAPTIRFVGQYARGAIVRENEILKDLLSRLEKDEKSVALITIVYDSAVTDEKLQQELNRMVNILDKVGNIERQRVFFDLYSTSNIQNEQTIISFVPHDALPPKESHGHRLIQGGVIPRRSPKK